MAIHTLLEARDRASLLERADRLLPDTAPRWGRMDVGQMMRHCVEALRASLGDVVHRPAGPRLFRTRIVRRAFIRLVPMPRNAPTAPELRMTAPADLDSERQRLRDLVQRYGTADAGAARAEHPLFGTMSREEWAELEYKHLDHHLRQFRA